MTALRRLLPTAVEKPLHALWSLGPRAGAIYLKQQCLRTLGRKQDSLGGVPVGATSILFVCQGNIIRSPMAAALLLQQLAHSGLTGVSVTSAGLRAHSGCAADPRAVIAAQGFGISLRCHKARPVTGEMIRRAEVILAMDFLNEARLLARFPEAAGKLFLLGPPAAGGRRPRQIEIADPFEGDLGDVRRCYQTLDGRIRSLTAHLFPAAAGDPAPGLKSHEFTTSF